MRKAAAQRHSALDERPLAADGVDQSVIGASPAAASSYTPKDAEGDERFEVRNPQVRVLSSGAIENPRTSQIRFLPEIVRQRDASRTMAPRPSSTKAITAA